MATKLSIAQTLRRFGFIGQFNNPESKTTEANPGKDKNDLPLLEKDILQALANRNHADPDTAKEHYTRFDSCMKKLRYMAQHGSAKSGKAAEIYAKYIVALMPSVRQIFADVNPDLTWVVKQLPTPSQHHFKVATDQFVERCQAQFADQYTKPSEEQTEQAHVSKG